jgi:hypothetical protein
MPMDGYDEGFLNRGETYTIGLGDFEFPVPFPGLFQNVADRGASWASCSRNQIILDLIDLPTFSSSNVKENPGSG